MFFGIKDALQRQTNAPKDGNISANTARQAASAGQLMGVECADKPKRQIDPTLRAAFETCSV
jgi:hypothetical protein